MYRAGSGYAQMTHDGSEGFMASCDQWENGGADSRGTWTAITDPSECAAARSALSLRGDGTPGIVDSAAWRPYGCMVKTRGGGTDYVFLNLDGRAVGQASTSDANAICKLTANALQGTDYGAFGLWVARTLAAAK